ncbi:MAG: rod shape-determining protein MreD [Planctomycetota bacterium]
MTIVKWILLVYVVLASKLVFGSDLAGHEFLPDGMLVLALLALLTIEHPLAFAVAGVIGLVGDLFWGDRLGTSMLCLAVVGYAMGGIRRWFTPENPLRSVTVAWFLAATLLLARAVLIKTIDGGAMNPEDMLIRAAWEGFWCGVAVFGADFLLRLGQDRWSLIFQAAGS